MRRAFSPAFLSLAHFAGLIICFLLLFTPLAAQLLPVAEIQVSGLKKTKEKVILREMTFAPGDSLSAGEIEVTKEKNHNNIYNLGLFTRVKLEEEITDSGWVFRINLQERWYVWPLPYVALEERTFNEWWADKDLDRLVFGMGVEWYNFTGWNDKLTLYAQGGYSRRAAITYNRPFLIPRWQVNAQFGFQFVDQKELGFRTENGLLQFARLRTETARKSFTGFVALTKRFSPRKRLTLTLRYQHYRLNDSLSQCDYCNGFPQENPNYFTTGTNVEQYPMAVLSYVNDQRDLASFPMKGYKYGFLVRQSGLPGIGTARFFNASASWSQHIPLNKRFNFAYGTTFMYIIGRNVPWFDKYFLGWSNQLRGYERYVVDGSLINMTKAEFKYSIFPRRMVHWGKIPFKKFQDFPFGLYLSAFCDAGYVHDRTNNNIDGFLKDKLLLGYGLGLNVITLYDFLLRLEFSWNHLGQWNFNPNRYTSIQ